MELVSEVVTTGETIETKISSTQRVLYRDEIAAMVGKADYKAVARRGQFYILDKNTQAVR